MSGSNARLGPGWLILLFFMGCSQTRDFDVESDWESFREREKVEEHFKIPIEANILRIRTRPFQARGHFTFAPLHLDTRDLGYIVEIDFTLPDHRAPVEWLFRIARESGVKEPKARYRSSSTREHVYLNAPTDEIHYEDIETRLTVVTGSEPFEIQGTGLAFFPPDSRRKRERQIAFYRCRWYVCE